MKLPLFAAAAVWAPMTAAPAFAEDAAPATVDGLIVTGRAGLEAQRKVDASYAITTGARYYLARPELGRAFRVAVQYRF